MLRPIHTLWRVLRHSTQFERDMRDEMLFHVEMEAERLARSGLDAREARRQARVRFGGIEKYKEAGRDGAGSDRSNRYRSTPASASACS
jgi:hypothetical protein